MVFRIADGCSPSDCRKGSVLANHFLWTGRLIMSSPTTPKRRRHYRENVRPTTRRPSRKTAAIPGQQRPTVKITCTHWVPIRSAPFICGATYPQRPSFFRRQTRTHVADAAIVEAFTGELGRTGSSVGQAGSGGSLPPGRPDRGSVRHEIVT